MLRASQSPLGSEWRFVCVVVCYSVCNENMLCVTLGLTRNDMIPNPQYVSTNQQLLIPNIPTLMQLEISKSPILQYDSYWQHQSKGSSCEQSLAQRYVVLSSVGPALPATWTRPILEQARVWADLGGHLGEPRWVYTKMELTCTSCMDTKLWINHLLRVGWL